MKEERKEIRVNNKHFTMIGNRLFWGGADGVLHRCMIAIEIPSIVTACHNSVCDGHYSGQLTSQKALRVGYFWLTLF